MKSFTFFLILRMAEKENTQKHIAINFLQIKTTKMVEKNVISLLNLTVILRQASCTAKHVSCSWIKIKESQNKLLRFHSKADQEEWKKGTSESLWSATLWHFEKFQCMFSCYFEKVNTHVLLGFALCLYCQEAHKLLQKDLSETFAYQ